LRGSQLKQHQWGGNKGYCLAIIFRILINPGPASTNGGWVLIFTKFRSRLKVVKESFNSVDVLNRFKLIKL